MNFKNSLRLSTSDYALIVKSMVYRFVVFVVMFTITYFLAKDILLYCNKQKVFTELSSDVKSAFFGFFKGENWHNGKLLRSDFKNCFTAVNKSVFKHKFKFICLIFVLFVYSFLTIFADVATTDIINNRMSVYSHAGFFGSFLRNFKTGILYGLFFILYQIVFFTIITLISIGLTYLLFNLIGMFTLPIIIFLIIIALSCKQTLISLVLPSVLVEKTSLWKALLTNKSAKHFKQIFPGYFVFYFFALIANIMVSVFSFGAGAIVTIPLSHILVNTIGLINYYEIKKLKYYLSYNAVYKPQPYNENELFSDND